MFRISTSNLLRCFSPNTCKHSPSSTLTSAEFEKKLEHYRSLHELESTHGKPEGWDAAKPFEEIPGPKPWPLVGNLWRFVVPKFGDFYGMDFFDVHKLLYKKYGDVSILKGVTEHPVVIIYNPKDFETLYRNEGVWPIRRNLPSLDTYHEMRKDVYKSFGLLSYHGEQWFKTRSVVSPILMQPKNIAQYTEKMSRVADELVDNIECFSKQNKDGEMPVDFQNELYKWALESIGVVTLDTHLGCLKRDLEANSEADRMVNSATQIFELMYRLDLQPSLYKYLNTPDWKQFVGVLDFLMETNAKHIARALDHLEGQEVDSEDHTKSVLKQLLKKDKDVAVAMAMDMIAAGIDTTGRVMGATLYYLGKNPAVQKKLREEAVSLLPSKTGVVTKELLARAPYLKATIKEATRFAPIAAGNIRTTVKDLVLAGYRIPKGTDVCTSNLVLCLCDRHFPRAGEFLPERWLSAAPADISHKSAHPFVCLPFGFGPRGCVGRRIATLELEVALLKIIRNFEVSWGREDMRFASTTLYGIADPLRIRVRAVPH